jgi:hypothetical protein
MSLYSTREVFGFHGTVCWWGLKENAEEAEGAEVSRRKAITNAVGAMDFVEFRA